MTKDFSARRNRSKDRDDHPRDNPVTRLSLYPETIFDRLFTHYGGIYRPYRALIWSISRLQAQVRSRRGLICLTSFLLRSFLPSFSFPISLLPSTIVPLNSLNGPVKNNCMRNLIVG